MYAKCKVQKSVKQFSSSNFLCPPIPLHVASLMGCASSSPDKEDALDAGAQSSPPPNAPSPGQASKAEVAPPPQPLYSGPPSSPAPSPSSPIAPTQTANATPTTVSSTANASVTTSATPSVLRSLSKRQGSKTQNREYDEESDWDQCSTNFEHEEAADVITNDGRRPSFVEKATHKAMTAGVPLAYKETSTLRIDKVKGCMFVNQYLVVKFLGRGACGKVFLCLNTHDLRLYAMKAVRKVDLESSQPQPQPGAKRRNPMDDLKREIMIMKKMKHGNIVTLSEVIDDPAGSKLLLVMEYMDGGPVLTREALEKRERLPESLARQYFRDMLKALDYLHAHKVVHGDLKPENVLMVASGEVKLSDFGCSKVFATGNEYLERCNGTPAFLAPEMMKPNTRYRGRPTDVYALGACLYTLLFGRIPFSAPNLYKLFQVVQNDPVRYPEDVPISDSLRDILGQMLVKNPRERILLTDMMHHPWVTMDGRFPLKSHRELKKGETNEDHDSLPEGRTFMSSNPKPDMLAGLSGLSRHERSFNEGDLIMRQGENATYLLYIVSGSADILVKWALPPKKQKSVANMAPQAQQQQQQAPAAAAAGGGDEFMDESETMSPIVDQESRDNRLKLLRASTKAQDFIKKLQEAAAGGVRPISRDLLIAKRGPGELIGDMGLFSKNHHRQATVRCSSKLVVRVILPDQLESYLSTQPMARNQMRESILRKESEVTMVEALMKMANVHDVIVSSLEAQAPSGGAAPQGGGATSPRAAAAAAVPLAVPGGGANGGGFARQSLPDDTVGSRSGSNKALR